MKLKSIVATLSIIIVLVVGLVGFTQCGKADMARLVRADSMLVRERGDSAMRLLRTLDPNDLTSENNAYYAILYTQAQYKLQMPMLSDSLINIAVRYYTDNFDQRRLTDALMYRGAVYADLNFKRMAIDSYKDAEEIADTTDWMTIGLLNFRIGELYQNSYIENSEPIARYKKAALYFREAHNEAFEHYSYGFLGQMYSVKNYDSAYYYINKTIDWAIEQGNQEQLLNGCRVNLAKLYVYHNINLGERINLLLSVYHNRDMIVVGSDVLHLLSDSYSKLGKIDSAKYYAAQFPQSEQLVDTMSYHMMLESLAIAQGDYKTAYKSKIIASQVAEKIVSQGKAEEYYAIDKQYDNSVANSKIVILNQEKTTHQLVIAIFVLTFIIVGLFVWLYIRNRRKAMIDQQRTIDQLHNEIENQQYFSQRALNENIDLIQGLNKTIEERKELEQTLRGIAEDRTKILERLLSLKHKCGKDSEKFAKQINDAILFDKKSLEDCQAIVDMANQLYGGIIDYYKNRCSSLSFNEQLLLALTCMEFGSIETKMVLDVASINAVYTARNRLASKLGVSNLSETIKETKRILIQK